MFYILVVNLQVDGKILKPIGTVADTTKIRLEQKWPFFNEKDYGFMMENYGHEGKAGDGGIGIGEFTIYDWGNGAASEAFEKVYAENTDI